MLQTHTAKEQTCHLTNPGTTYPNATPHLSILRNIVIRIPFALLHVILLDQLLNLSHNRFPVFTASAPHLKLEPI